MSLQQIRFLMGTDIEIQIFQRKTLKDYFFGQKVQRDMDTAFEIFEKMEQKFSRFREDSELSQINIQRGGKMSPEFQEVYTYMQEFYTETEGYFNPLVNVSSIGYDKSFEKIYKKQEKQQNIPQDINTDFSSIKTQGDTIELQIGQNLDFGGIVKGYSVDKVKNFLREKGYKNFLINAGGDIWIEGKDISGKHMTIGIDHPVKQEDIFAMVELSGASLSTSGSYKRKWKVGEKQYHHILNPIGEIQDTSILSVSLIAEDCMTADVYATSCIAMGYEKSKKFLESHNIAGCIVDADAAMYQSPSMKNYNITLLPV